MRWRDGGSDKECYNGKGGVQCNDQATCLAAQQFGGKIDTNSTAATYVDNE